MKVDLDHQVEYVLQKRREIWRKYLDAVMYGPHDTDRADRLGAAHNRLAGFVHDVWLPKRHNLRNREVC